MEKNLLLNDYADASRFLGCSQAAIRAVASVESGGRGGFDEKGRVLIRFEGHIFQRLTKGIFNKTHPQVSYPYHKKHRSCGGMHGYTAFNTAMTLDSIAAMKSCSIGMFQPMVFNFHEMGYSSPEEMWNDFRQGEKQQLMAFCRLIKNWGLDDELRRATLADFTVFARTYNGKDFKANDYHNKMFRAFGRYKNSVVPSVENMFSGLHDDEITFHDPLSHEDHTEPAESLPINPAVSPSTEPDDSGAQSVISETTPSAEAPPAVPQGDLPETPPRAWLNVEDWKPWVFSKLKSLWTMFTGTNATQFAANFYGAINSGESWWVYAGIAAGLFILSLIVCAVISLILLAIRYFNRNEIREYIVMAKKSVLDPASVNLGLTFEKIGATDAGK